MPTSPPGRITGRPRSLSSGQTLSRSMRSPRTHNRAIGRDASSASSSPFATMSPASSVTTTLTRSGSECASMQSVSSATPRANSRPSIPPSGLRRSQVYAASTTANHDGLGSGVELQPGAVVDDAGRAQVGVALEPGDGALGAGAEDTVGTQVQPGLNASHIVAAATDAKGAVDG